MPELGEIVLASKIGYGSPRHYVIFVECSQCHRQYWRRLDTHQNAINKEVVCKHCSNKVTAKWCRGEVHHSWKGGRRKQGGKGENQYIGVKLQPTDFFYPMATKSGYVMEHRLVMARHLKRHLLPWEIVHHRYGNRTDNRLENLELISCQGKHNTAVQRQLNQLTKKIIELEIEITILKGEKNVSQYPSPW